MSFLSGLFKSKYVTLLEAEVERLQQENRALLNNLLAHAGYPPVDYKQANTTMSQVKVRRRPSFFQWQMQREMRASSSAPVKPDGKTAVS